MKKRLTREQKFAATLTIHRAGDMTSEGRKELARWIREHATELVKSGSKYAKRFTARYYYR